MPRQPTATATATTTTTTTTTTTIPPYLLWGDGGGGHWLVRMEWRPAGWSASASVNLPLHHKVQKFSSGTDSPGWSQS